MPYQIIVGVDETGRGAIAGPLVIGATAFPREMKPIKATYVGVKGETLVRVNDSKKVTSAAQREALDRAIRSKALAYTVVEKSAREIDTMTMRMAYPEALKLAVSRVLEQLLNSHYYTFGMYDQVGNNRSGLAKRIATTDVLWSRTLVLFDGDIEIPRGLPCPAIARPKADEMYWQVSAASILAKVHRDSRMLELARKHPHYDFDENNGYPTRDHKAIIRRLGESPAHRRTYAPVRDLRPPTVGVED